LSEGFKLTEKEMKYISLFEAATGVTAIDCVESGDLIVFVVREGDLKKVLSKGGSKIQEFSRIIKKRVKVIELSEDPGIFVKNALMPARLSGPVRIASRPDGRKIAIASVEPKDKGLAIGKNGKTIELVRLLAKRHYSIDHITIQ